MWSSNLDALKRIECEKIRVAYNDVGRMPAHRNFQEFVVVGITAGCYPHVYIDPLRFARQRCDEGSDIFLIYRPPKLLSA